MPEDSSIVPKQELGISQCSKRPVGDDQRLSSRQTLPPPRPQVRCWRCYQAHLACDTQKPSCTPCRLKGRPCQYGPIPVSLKEKRKMKPPNGPLEGRKHRRRNYKDPKLIDWGTETPGFHAFLKDFLPHLPSLSLDRMTPLSISEAGSPGTSDINNSRDPTNAPTVNTSSDPVPYSVSSLYTIGVLAEELLRAFMRNPEKEVNGSKE
ncbi:MAG: hypothetical protein DHS80DRAFT_31382 [Piptocephalis tieghemiana]|nr:MAG: hypothetical protein DHS80DRAFT_31382 [Piptocephalis tieghemiana]